MVQCLFMHCSTRGWPLRKRYAQRLCKGLPTKKNTVMYSVWYCVMFVFFFWSNKQFSSSSSSSQLTLWHLFPCNVSLNTEGYHLYEFILNHMMSTLYRWCYFPHTMPLVTAFPRLITSKVTDYDSSRIAPNQMREADWLFNSLALGGVLIMLTHWDWDEMITIFQLTFSNAFSWMRIVVFW